MEARDLDEARDKHIQGFLGKLMVRDLRHMARARGVEGYKEMKKKDLADSLFSTHFMQKRDKEKFNVQKVEDPLPNPATGSKGLARVGTATRRYDAAVAAPQRVMKDMVANESHAPTLPTPPPPTPKNPKAEAFLRGLTLDNLHQAATKLKIKGHTRMNRDKLIDSILLSSRQK